MKSIYTPLIGRFGNQLFQYCHARALAEREGFQLNCPQWVGESIFDIPIAGREQGEMIGGYGQNQESLIYTRTQIRQWLQIKPELLERLKTMPQMEVAAHRRVGDYVGYGYPIQSNASYYRAASKIGIPFDESCFVCEENPTFLGGISENFSCLADWFRLYNAKVLFRANSSFSWWAAALGNATVYSPIIDGLQAGEHDCEFVHGNWPKLADQYGFTDLHLAP